MACFAQFNPTARSKIKIGY